jgi:hypothetical protein
MTSVTVPNLSPRGAIAAGDYMLVQAATANATLATATAGQVAAFAAAQAGQILVQPSGDASGATDTAAIQGALNTGKNVLLGSGVFYTNADLTLTAQSQCGQRVMGAAPSDQAGGGNGATIIKPTAAVMNGFRIDGSSYGGYIQSVGIENLTIDMSNMLANSNAIKQLQAYDVTYSRIRVVGDGNGNGKSSLYFGPGAYTTSVRNLWGGLISIIGTGVNNPTTIKFDKCDARQFNATQCAQITWEGGAIQPVYYSSMTKVYVAAGSATIPAGISTATGCYLILTGYVSFSDNVTVLNTDYETGAGGFPTTYNDGAHGALNAYPVFQVGSNAFRTCLINMSLYSSYVYDLNNNVNMLGANVGVGSPTFVSLFRDGIWADQTLSVVNGHALRGYSDRGVTQSFILDASTGTQTLRNIVIQPTTVGNFDTHLDPSGNTVFACYTANDGNGAHNSVFFPQTVLTFYADQAATTPTATISAATGGATFRQMVVQPGANGSNTVTWNNAGGSTFFGAFTSSTLTSCQLFLNNGAMFIGYSDNALTQTLSLNASSGNVNISGKYQVGSTQVVGPRITGWSAPSGGARQAYAAYAGQTINATYSQTQAQTTDNAVKVIGQVLAQVCSPSAPMAQI